MPAIIGCKFEINGFKIQIYEINHLFLSCESDFVTVKFNLDDMKSRSYAVKIEIYKVKPGIKKIKLETIDMKHAKRIPSSRNASALCGMSLHFANRLSSLRIESASCRMFLLFVN